MADYESHFFLEPVFFGHDNFLDKSYGTFNVSDLPIVKKYVKELGWKVQNSGIRREYDGYDVISAGTDEFLEAIPGYRDRSKRIDYMILRIEGDNVHMTFSSQKYVTPFTQKNFDIFVTTMESNGVHINLPN